jgi:cellulose synthase/poly-beta-1,6-N-acetylglucosamine synthase-like glycosyltransferase
LKTRESALDSCLGANGAIYAIRKSHWPAIPDKTFVDDFVIGMRVREAGHRVIYDTEALATEELPLSVGHEMTRRIRIGAGDFQALFLCWRSLLPWRGFYSIAFWSHKVLRWFAPFLMIAALVSNIALLPQPFFAVLLALQLAFYGLAILGALIRRRKIVLFSAPCYFVTINLALLLGFFRFITGTQQAAWKRTAR